MSRKIQIPVGIFSFDIIMTDLRFKPKGDCIFIHIPKTAGISISESVLDLDRPFGWFKGADKKYFKPPMMKELFLRSWPKTGASTLGHFHYKVLMDNKKLDQQYFDNSFKFAFVRNPYDRLVSLYKYHRVEKLLELSFDDFVLILSQEFRDNRVPPVGLYNIKNFPETSPLHHPTIYGNQYNPMTHWLPNDNVLICYLETFEQDIDHILSLLGFQGHRQPVPKKNKAKYDDDFITFYTNQETIRLVNLMYKDDFERFGYDMI